MMEKRQGQPAIKRGEGGGDGDGVKGFVNRQSRNQKDEWKTIGEMAGKG